MADVFHSFRDFISNTSINAVWSGLTTTLFITVTGILLGTLLAAALCAASRSKWRILQVVEQVYFKILWRYFAWSNQTLSLFAFLVISVWMFENGKQRFVWMPLIPGTFYAFATVTYIMNAKIGFNLPWTAAYIIGGTAAAVYLAVILWYRNRRAAHRHL